MFSKTDFENIVWDFLFTYRQFLLIGYLHKRVNHEAYETNTATWNTLLLSLETGALLGLAKLLERTNDLGRPFDNLAGKTFDNKKFDGKELNNIANKILKLMGRMDLKPKILNQVENEIKHQYLSAGKARELLDWKPKYDLDSALAETVEWYTKFFKRVEQASRLLNRSNRID